MAPDASGDGHGVAAFLDAYRAAFCAVTPRLATAHVR